MTDDQSLIAFATVPGIGPARLKLLIEYFGAAKKAWEASEKDLSEVGLPAAILSEFLLQRERLDVTGYITNLRNRGIKIITIDSPDYPDRLKQLSDAPNVLFIKSQLTSQQINQLTLKKIIGVVGTRKITSYGKEVTEQLTASLVGAGFTIVSGMALGVDGVAHGTTINNGGKTIAVLGAGVDIIYPPSHRDLYNSILDHDGVILSEVAPEKTVIRGIFPARNRIISGLSEAVLITEGAIDSGSLITAKAALEQGREVFAVPGPINSAMAEGTNYLLKQGAKLVTSVDDILEGLGYEGASSEQPGARSKNIVGETVEEQKIIDLLINEAMEFDEIVKKSAIPAFKLGAILGAMEVKGQVKTEGSTFRLS